jgi:chemotaxis protein CheX
MSEANLLDAVGEIANTIAGNVRRHFGGGLEISVPVRLAGQAEGIKAAVRARPFVIALGWRGHEAMVVVDIAPAE